MKNWIFILLFGVLLFFSALVRLYRFDNPIADWHSWRQADTSAVSWHFVYEKFDIFHPKYFDISNVQSKKDNPEGYRFVEFPLYNIAQAGLFELFHIFTLEEWGRVVTIVMSLVCSTFLFFITKRHAKETVAWLVLIFSLFLPYNIYYGRTILPDTSMVAMVMGGIYCLDIWLERLQSKKSSYQFFLLACVFTAMSLLLKPYAIFYAVTMFVMVWNMWGKKLFQKWELYIFATVSLIPLVWWRTYMLKYPEGIPVNLWLFNGDGIRFRPAFFRWIFYERLTKLISGYVNVIFVVFGVKAIWKERKNRLFFLSFVVSALLYVIVIATGNVRQDYYQIVIMPAVALMMGWGSYFLIKFLSKYTAVWISYALVGLVICIGFFLSWQQVKDYFNINNIAIVHGGEAVARLTPKNAKIIAPYGGDTSLLYYTKRKGWPSFEHSLVQLIAMGADYMILVNPTSSDYALGGSYKIVAKTKEYILFDLHKNP